jgi:tight adherence protein B
VAEEAGRWAAANPTPEVRAAAVALSLGASGVAIPSLGVEAVAAGLRARHAAAAELRAHSAQARLSAAVLAVLPLAFTAWVALTQPHALAYLVGTPAGLGCLGAGLALEAVGLVWILAILRDAA